MKGGSRRKSHFLRTYLLAEWGSYLIGLALFFLWAQMEKRLQDGPVKAEPPDSFLSEKKKQPRRYFDILFTIFNFITWLKSFTFLCNTTYSRDCICCISCQRGKKNLQMLDNVVGQKYMDIHVVGIERLCETSSIIIIQIVSIILPLCLEILCDSCL